MNADEVKAVQAKIAELSGRREAEIDKLMQQKQADLKGLIGREAALYLVAKELGVEGEWDRLQRGTKGARGENAPASGESDIQKGNLPITDIADIKPGMRNFFCVGRVTRIIPTMEFPKKADNTIGKLATFFLRDATGEIRFPLWDDEVQVIDEHRFDVGDIIRVINVHARLARDGRVELNLKPIGKLERNPVDVKLPPLSPEQRDLTRAAGRQAIGANYEKKHIADVRPGERISLQGTVVKPIDRLFFYEACENCKKKAGTCGCPPGKSPITRAVLNATFDDGTGMLRLALFGEVVDQFLGEVTAEIAKLADTPAYDAKLAELSRKVMGREVVVQGRAKENLFFASSGQAPRVEIMVDETHVIDAAVEARILLNKMLMSPATVQPTTETLQPPTVPPTIMAKPPQGITPPEIPETPFLASAPSSANTTASLATMTPSTEATHPKLPLPVPEVTGEAPPVAKSQPIAPSTPTPTYQSLKLYTTPDGYLTRPIPYWVAKLLIHYKRLAKSTGYKVVGQAPLPFEQVVEDAKPLYAEGAATLNLAAEEARVERILHDLNKTQKTVEQYLLLWQALLQFKSRLDLDTDEELEVLYEIEEIEQTLQREGFEWFVGTLVSGAKNLAADGILMTKSKDVKALPQFYAPVVEEGGVTEARIKRFYQRWEDACRKLRQYAEPLLDQAAEFPETEEITTESPQDKLFNGQKFHFLSFDINNLHISTKKKFPQQVVDVLSRIKQEILPKHGKYVAYYFATKQLEFYKIKNPADEKNQWFIEFRYKGKDEHDGWKYVDVDTTLAAKTYNFLDVHRSQIERFTLGSGDKDLHVVCKLAKDHGIPVEIVVAEQGNLSVDLRNVAEKVRTLY